MSFDAAADTAARLPLAGVRVFDLTRALAGPFCTAILGDLGADVVKVEPLPKGDMIRGWGPFHDGVSAYYLSTNRNKRAIAVDFRRAEGQQLLWELATASDVVVENFKAGTMEAMGLDYERLRIANPRLIYAGISGFGRDGPAGQWPGFDQIAQGYSGLMSVTGTVESGPVRVGVAVGDLASGMWTAIGVLGAVVARQASGRGQRIDTSLLASLVSLLSVQGQRYLSLGEVPGPTGNVHPVISPYGVFEAADGPLNVACGTEAMWERLCVLLGMPEAAADERFANNQQRTANRDALKALIDGKLSRATRAEWTARMIEAGIPAGPINTIADVFADAQVQHARLVEDIAHPVLGQLRQIGNPLRMEGLRERTVRRAPPEFGQHTLEVLGESGIDPARIAGLVERGIVLQDATKN